MDRNVRESVVWISVDDHSRSHAVLEFANVPYDSFTVPDDHRRRSEEHTSELQSRLHLVCRLLLEKKTSVDLGEDQVVADAEGVLAAAVERFRRHAAAVALARQRAVDEPVEELVPLVLAHRHARSD